MSDPLAAIPLSAIRVFEAAARLSSFTRAAEELGISQAAVRWQGLETVRLFPSLMTALCAPQVAAAIDLTRGPSALAQAPRIGIEAEWAVWFRAAGVASAGTDEPQGPLRFAAESQTTEVAAAL